MKYPIGTKISNGRLTWVIVDCNENFKRNTDDYTNIYQCVLYPQTEIPCNPKYLYEDYMESEYHIIIPNFFSDELFSIC